MKKILFLLLVQCGIILTGCSTVSFKEIWQEKNFAEREKLQDIMQSHIDRLPKKDFDEFDNAPDMATGNPVLKYYDQSLERLVRDIPATKVKPGTAVIWYLYNLGFVIKTPEVCFGVDIHHRHAGKLEPFLDFIAVTHNHSDHYSMMLMGLMTQTGKPVISNFYPNKGYTKAAEYTHEIKGVKIHCSEADHNWFLKKFTMPMEFVCPTGDKKFVFFTSGDCYREKFLNRKSEKIHVYALHPRCGMKTVNAARKLDPDLTLIGHLQELGHDVNVYRWTFNDGREQVKNLKNDGRLGYVPVWGEKFLWDGQKVIPCQ